MQARKDIIIALAKGLAVSVGVTVIGMLLLAIAVVLLPVSDGALLGLNQVLKVIALFAGALAAVGIGGQQGFLRGGALGIVYMALGYGVYSILDRTVAPAQLVAAELAMGALLGAISGAISANLSPRTRTRLGALKAGRAKTQ